jgi:hypothetical protein
MCVDCDARDAALQALPVAQREVPQRSGEAAIYSPEYLARKEGNALGTRPEAWRSNLFG